MTSSTVTTLLTAKPSVTIPLTTIFTPPPDCSTSWTYEAQFYNSVPGGILIQNAFTHSLDTSCFPNSFPNNGRQPSAMLYSPGVCPHGYTSPVVQEGGSITTAVCCLTNYIYTTVLTHINNFGTSSVIFEGCISTFPSNSTTQVQARSSDEDLNSTTVSGPLTMWAQPITVEWQSTDSSLFPASTTSFSTTSTTASAGPTSLIAVQTNPASLASTTSSSTSALGTGAIAGIAVGGAVVLIALLAALILFILRRRRSRRDGAHRPLVVPVQDGDEKAWKHLAAQDGVYRPANHHPPGELMGELMGKPMRGELNAEPSEAGRPVRGQSGLHEMSG